MRPDNVHMWPEFLISDWNANLCALMYSEVKTLYEVGGLNCSGYTFWSTERYDTNAIQLRKTSAFCCCIAIWPSLRSERKSSKRVRFESDYLNQCCVILINLGQFGRKCSRYLSLMWVWKLLLKIASTFPRGQWVNEHPAVTGVALVHL